ncbi:hypothetical protein BH10PLA1_BH10PLA1_17100 [soil metagenome]
MADKSEIPVLRNEPILVLVLGLVTCGLYMIYWNMKTAEVLNKISGKEVIAQPVAILAGCCVPLNVYFYYLAGQSLADLGRMIGKEDELKGKSTLLLVLGFVLSPVAAMIVQGHLNELYDQK